MAGALVISLPICFRCVELVGEVGEAANVMKKLERARLGIAGSRATPEDLADELADVAICADLIAMDLGLELVNDALFGHVRAGSAETLAFMGVDLGRCLSRVCALVETVSRRHDFGWVSPAVAVHLAGALEMTIACAHKIAESQGIDLSAAVVYKFNQTSEKLGFATRLAIPALV
jgi:hypothetical protein